MSESKLSRVFFSFFTREFDRISAIDRTAPVILSVSHCVLRHG